MNNLDNIEIFICHHCIDYKTFRRKDISNHVNRKNKCICNNTSISFENAKILSLHSRYIFKFDEKNLSMDDYIYIVNNYQDKKNYILENFKKDILENFKKDIPVNDSINNIIKDSSNKFECVKCKTSYTSKQNLIKHLLNQELCASNKKRNEILETNKLP